MSRLNNLKEQNTKYNKTLIDAIGMIDPSGKNTYVDFLMKHVKNMYSSDHIKNSHRFKDLKYELMHSYKVEEEKVNKFSEIDLLYLIPMLQAVFNTSDVALLNKFNEMRELGKLSWVDITKLSSFDEMGRVLSMVELREMSQDLKKQVIKHYEDDEWLIVLPLTHLSSKKYGSNTKWCTTSDDFTYFRRYSSKGLLIYTMNKKDGHKIATYYSLQVNEPELSFWDPSDRRIDSMESNLPTEIIKEIKSVIKNYKKTNFDFLVGDELKKEMEYYASLTKKSELLFEEPIPIPMEMNEVNIPLRHQDDYAAYMDNQVPQIN